MARASHIYVVHPVGSQLNILAVFTVKYESQLWAERRYGLDKVERYRMRDAGWCDWIGNSVGEKIPVPWEIADILDTGPWEAKDGKESVG